ncbi:MAG: hypothetical protein IKO85_00745 [Bacteroidaceae bacterium]|nr:hypothetical protein [Bacteroidaceae bacterium]
MNGTNVQNNLGIYVTSQLSPNDLHNHFYAEITKGNVGVMCVYLAIRQAIEATWQNDRDQYLVPTAEWRSDQDFINNCLIYTLFHGQNRISSAHGVNHWIPFTEKEVNAQEKFESHFMSDYIAGRLPQEAATSIETDLFTEAEIETITPQPLTFSPEATAVLNAGRELWRYYHAQPIAATHPNASFYDIRLHFQGTKTLPSGRQQMNTESTDPTYTTLITTLRQRMRALAAAIQPKVYAYGFLKH